MIYNKIKIAEEGEAYNRKEIALAIRNWTYDDKLKCSPMDQNIIKPELYLYKISMSIFILVPTNINCTYKYIY